MNNIEIKKTCGKCGKEHNQIPADARINEDGFWFECGCKSTLLMPYKKMIRDLDKVQAYLIEQYYKLKKTEAPGLLKNQRPCLEMIEIVTNVIKTMKESE